MMVPLSPHTQTHTLSVRTYGNFKAVMGPLTHSAHSTAGHLHVCLLNMHTCKHTHKHLLYGCICVCMATSFHKNEYIFRNNPDSKYLTELLI